MDDGDDETARVIDDATEEDDRDDDEVELIFRTPLASNDADESFVHCCDGAVNGGGGAARMVVFPLIPAVEDEFIPFRFTAP